MSNTADFTQGSILKKLCRFMLPVLGALILQAAYGAVDLLVVGRFGSTSGLSAVSTGSQVLNLVTFVVTQLAMGVTVLIARYIGEKREKEIGAVLGGAAVVFTILAGCLFVLLVLFARPISVLMQAPQEALALTASYVRICGCGILFIVAYNVLSAVFRGLGDSRSPLLFVLVACLVNVAGDLVLVAGLHLDAAGAALATVLAQAVSVGCALAILRRKKLPFTFRKSDVRLNEQCRRFLAIGLPLALQEFLTQLSFLALCAFVNRLGLAASSGYGVASKIVSFVMLVPSALMQSMASFVAQNIGAGNVKRAKKSMFTGIAVGVLAALLLKSTVFKGEAVPFVMELPNYRLPGLKNVAQLLWEKARDFLQKAFTVIFAATIVIWFLQNFDLQLRLTADPQASILARIAGDIAPLFGPLGFADWRISTALITGFMAKESVVSSLLILFGSEAALSAALTPAQAAPLLVFCLLYTPCIAAVASVKRELGNKWAVIMVVNQCAVAWLCALLVRLAAVALF